MRYFVPDKALTTARAAAANLKDNLPPETVQAAVDTLVSCLKRVDAEYPLCGDDREVCAILAPVLQMTAKAHALATKERAILKSIEDRVEEVRKEAACVVTAAAAADKEARAVSTDPVWGPAGAYCASLAAVGAVIALACLRLGAPPWGTALGGVLMLPGVHALRLYLRCLRLARRVRQKLGEAEANNAEVAGILENIAPLKAAVVAEPDEVAGTRTFVLQFLDRLERDFGAN